MYEVLPEGIEVGIASSDPKTGEYKVILPHDNIYGLRAIVPGYIPVEEKFDFRSSESDEYSEVKQNLFVLPLTVGQAVILKSVNFDRSKAEVRDYSYPELNRLVQIMKANPTMEIKLLGHTDNTGDKDWNLELSNNRVTNVKNFLVERGIKAKRITQKGYGGLKPIAKNDKEETRKLNRRVEYLITKI